MNRTGRIHFLAIVTLASTLFGLVLPSGQPGAVAATNIEAIRVTNVSDRAFTVAWHTSEPTTGTVSFGTDANQLTVTYDDVRTSANGPSFAGYTHYVRVSANLTEKTLYYMALRSGDATTFQTITTGPALTTQPSAPTITGTVYQNDNQTVASNVLVYLHLERSGLKSQTYSTYTQSNGIFSLSLAGLRTESNQDWYAPAASGDNVFYWADAGPGNVTNPGSAVDIGTITRDGIRIQLPNQMLPTPTPTQTNTPLVTDTPDPASVDETPTVTETPARSPTAARTRTVVPAAASVTPTARVVPPTATLPPPPPTAAPLPTATLAPAPAPAPVVQPTLPPPQPTPVPPSPTATFTPVPSPTSTAFLRPPPISGALRATRTALSGYAQKEALAAITASPPATVAAAPTETTTESSWMSPLVNVLLSASGLVLASGLALVTVWTITYLRKRPV